jgi:hypothetical protein
VARPRFLDPSSLTRAERIVAISAWLGVVNALLPWWYRAETDNGIQTHSAVITTGGTIAWACFGVAAVVILVRSWIWPDPAPHRDGAVYVLAGAGALVALSIQSFTLNSAWIGYIVAALLGMALTAGGLLRRRERRAGWR